MVSSDNRARAPTDPTRGRGRPPSAADVDVAYWSALHAVAAAELARTMVERDAAIGRMYTDGASLRQIGALAGMTVGAVVKALRRAGAPDVERAFDRRDSNTRSSNTRSPSASTGTPLGES
jgi:hypothetical protein